MITLIRLSIFRIESKFIDSFYFLLNYLSSLLKLIRFEKNSKIPIIIVFIIDYLFLIFLSNYLCSSASKKRENIITDFFILSNHPPTNPDENLIF